MWTLGVDLMIIKLQSVDPEGLGIEEGNRWEYIGLPWRGNRIGGGNGKIR